VKLYGVGLGDWILMRMSLQTTLVLLVLLATSRLAMADLDSADAAYERGDYKTAIVEFKALAEQGDAEAQYNLGMMYYEGEGVPEDYAAAVKWYRLAADQGHTSAQSNLGMMYYIGDLDRGVLEDFVQAYAWWNIAATQGHEDARHNKPKLAKQMTPSQIAEAQELSKELYEKIPH
jgi:TPR repeat protein